MAENKRDYYEVLGVDKGATEADLKKAYRRLAKENHPDLKPGDKAAEARFKEASEAYEVLSDPEKRSKYDQFGHAAFDPNSFQGGGYGGGFDFGDIFGGIFGGGFGDIFGGGQQNTRTGPQRGADIRTSLVIEFEEAAFGCTKEVNIPRMEHCEACSGTGCADGTTPETCSTCRGTGTVRTAHRTALGTIQTQSPCNQCGGTGKIIKTPCTTCRGAGLLKKTKKLQTNIPAGIDHGQTISLRGQGNAGKNGGPSGDLLVTIQVRPHKIFERDGNAVLLYMPISFVQAALGAELEVDTLDGKVKYSLPEGTQTGSVFRLKGKGIPHLNGSGRGDQYVTVEVEVPKNLSSQQKELLRQFGDAMGERTATPQKKSGGKSGGFFDKKKRKK